MEVIAAADRYTQYYHIESISTAVVRHVIERQAPSPGHSWLAGASIVSMHN